MKTIFNFLLTAGATSAPPPPLPLPGTAGLDLSSCPCILASHGTMALLDVDGCSYPSTGGRAAEQQSRGREGGEKEMSAASHFGVKAAYFLLFASLGSVLPFLPVLYSERNGFSQEQIGFLSTVSPIIKMIAGPILCHLTDAYGPSCRRTMLLSCMYSWIVTMSSLLLSKSFAWNFFV
ncbi:unnamed protein product, partial [Chrysoparadoxa australica]